MEGDFTSVRRLFAFFEVDECNSDITTVDLALLATSVCR
jgi:hypothetical protein